MPIFRPRTVLANGPTSHGLRALATADVVLATRDLTATGTTSLEANVEDYRAYDVPFQRVGDAIDVVQLFRDGISALVAGVDRQRKLGDRAGQRRGADAIGLC